MLKKKDTVETVGEDMPMDLPADTEGVTGDTQQLTAIAEDTPNIVDLDDPRITYQDEKAKEVKFTPDPNAVTIKVFADGQVITEF